LNSRVVPYRAGHLEQIFEGQLNHEAGESTLAFGAHADKLEVDGLSHSYIVNGFVIAVGGVALLWAGVGEGWVIASDRIYSHGIGVARSTRRLLDTMAKAEKLHRIQSAVLTSDERLPRFAKFLGFQREGEMRNYGVDKKNYDLYSRIL